jgi:hypothetical protein
MGRETIDGGAESLSAGLCGTDKGAGNDSGDRDDDRAATGKTAPCLGRRAIRGKSMVAKPNDDVIRKFGALVTDADRDGKKLPPLRAFLAEHPGICGQIGFFGETVVSSLIGKLVAKRAGSQTILRGQYNDLLKELGAADASPLEKLMINRIGLCWLRLMITESACALLLNGNFALKQCEHYDKELTRAHRRYTSAIESLSRLRVMTEAVKIAKAKAELMEARASEARMARANGALRLLNSATGSGRAG